MSNGPPERFRTSEHRWFRDEQPDGQVLYRKDGRFSNERAFDQAFLFAQTEVNIPDPDTGEERTIVANRGEASALGVVANNPLDDGTITVRTIDGNEITLTHQEVADHFSQVEGEGDDPVKYLE